MSNKKGNPGSGLNRKRNEKIFKRHEDSRKGLIAGRGPVGLIIAKIVDTLLNVVKEVLNFVWFSLCIPTFNFIWDVMFSEFKGVFAGKDKNGDCYNSSVLRYIITIFIPPVGVFMSKGFSGWPSIIICILLTFFHIFPGIIYAFIVTHNSRYADRYQAKELERIEEAKKKRGVENPDYGILPLIFGITILFGFSYLLLMIARFVSKKGKLNELG